MLQYTHAPVKILNLYIIKIPFFIIFLTCSYSCAFVSTGYSNRGQGDLSHVPPDENYNNLRELYVELLILLFLAVGFKVVKL